jgi:hypothetical protein
MIAIQSPENITRFFVSVKLTSNEKVRPPVEASFAPIPSLQQILEENIVVTNGNPS